MKSNAVSNCRAVPHEPLLRLPPDIIEWLNARAVASGRKAVEGLVDTLAHWHQERHPNTPIDIGGPEVQLKVRALTSSELLCANRALVAEVLELKAQLRTYGVES